MTWVPTSSARSRMRPRSPSSARGLEIPYGLRGMTPYLLILGGRAVFAGRAQAQPFRPNPRQDLMGSGSGQPASGESRAS